MFQNLDVFKTAMAMARHAGRRQALGAQNIANADTPGYHARELPKFQESVRHSRGALQATRPGHVFFGDTPAMAERERMTKRDPNGNSVSLELEMVEAVDAKRQHDRALAIYRSNLTILRTSIGHK